MKSIGHHLQRIGLIFKNLNPAMPPCRSRDQKMQKFWSENLL